MPCGEKTKELWENPQYRHYMSEVHKQNGIRPPSRKGVSLPQKAKEKLRVFWCKTT